MDVIKLVEKHRALLSEWDRKQHTFKSKYRPGQEIEQGIDNIPWPWTLVNLIQLLAQYPSGLSEAVLCSELEVLWDQVQSEFHTGNEQRAVASIATQLMSKSRGAVLLLDDDLKYELRILSVEKLPGSTIDILVVADSNIELSSIGNIKYRIESILHSKFLPLLNRGMFNEMRFQKQYLVSLKIAGSLHVEIREDSLFRLLPTTNVVFNLHAGWEQFTSLLGRDPIVPLLDLPGYVRQVPGDMAQIGLWMKIVSIQALNPQCLRRVVEVQDTSVEEPVEVIFSQAQVALVRTLEVGGYLGLYFPRVAYDGVKVVLEVEPATYLFYADPEGGNVGFKIEETKDQTFRLPQMTLKDIGPDMSAITMLVRVVTFTRNVPLENPKGGKNHRCTLVVEDSTGVSYVTFWEQAVAAIAESCIPGHLLLLEGIHTTAAPKQALSSNVFINAHPNERFQFTNISTLKGVLNTLSVASKILLIDLDSWFSSNISKSTNFVGECLITACIPVIIPNATQDKWFFTVQTHRHCRQPVKEYHANLLQGELRSKILGDYFPGPNETIYHCEHCSTCISQFDSQIELDRCFSLAWALDDGTRQIICYGFWKASLDLLKISPAELLSIEGIDGAHSTQPSFPLHLIQGSSIKTPPSFRMPAAAQSIIGHKFRVGVSKLPDLFPLDESMGTGFPFPKELGFSYSLNMAHPIDAVPLPVCPLETGF